ADWLDDHGQPERAEFIRVQIDLARLAPDDPQRADLIERESDLLVEHGDRWRAPLRALGATWMEFRRGLVEAVRLDRAATAIQIRALFRFAPVRNLWLLKADPGCVGELARMPEVARLRQLTI